ncbi:EamA/RhaT family transporter [Streptomyces sp. NPDC047000]|uniref:EamA/RhaT family transporter n=1 Tax=Streptomyces sp. NPDC047000 TaxID=3155474 RepID=UPI0033DCD02A
MSSDENGTPATPAGSPAAPALPGGPRPEPLRFFGTSWVAHDDNYLLRRLGVTVGSLAAVIVSCLVLRFAYQGLEIADIGSFVTVLVVVMFAVCSALAFGHSWEGFGKRPDADRTANLRGLLAIGFVGALAAYFVRSLAEAPGEKLHRQEYEAARTQHERRSRNPAKKRRRT